MACFTPFPGSRGCTQGNVLALPVLSSKLVSRLGPPTTRQGGWWGLRMRLTGSRSDDLQASMRTRGVWCVQLAACDACCAMVCSGEGLRYGTVCNDCPQRSCHAGVQHVRRVSVDCTGCPAGSDAHSLPLPPVHYSPTCMCLVNQHTRNLHKAKVSAAASCQAGR